MTEIGSLNSLLRSLFRCSNDNTEFKRISQKAKSTTLSEADVKWIYRELGFLLLNPLSTEEVVFNFRDQILNILCFILNEFSYSGYEHQQHLCNSVALARLIILHPDVGRITVEYFKKYPSPFEFTVTGTHSKKCSNEENNQTKITDVQLVDACYTFLKYSTDFFKSIWNWSSFIDKYFSHEDNMVKWLCCHCMGILTGMNELLLDHLLSSCLSKEQINNCLIQYEAQKNIKRDFTISYQTSIEKTENFPQLSESFSIPQVTNVGGIFLPTNSTRFKDLSHTNIVEVESTKRNLHKIALGIAANKAVCLQGPVGCGKTSLVEYIAAKTGRIFGQSFFKVQLGDQIDSKLLLGSYKCTDIPGEFIWQPGILTQAVTEGAWILLEDIDSANLDVATVLTALIENKHLTVPGYRDAIPVGSGFQLFLTQRLITTASGHHKKQTNSSTLLEKHVVEINIEFLSKNELEEIITLHYPSLKTVASRMVNVFLLFSPFNKNDEINLFKSGRLISTRDLFKWCSRAVIDFDVSNQASALKVLQDAIDIFCCSYSNIDERLKIARRISSELGIVNEKADYFCTKYKPNLILSSDTFKASRVVLERKITTNTKNLIFSFTRPSACLLEQIMCCISQKETVLLVGETGTGKTSAVQYLAHVLGQKLIVINMNQQSDSVDLLGGYKPVDLKIILAPLHREFHDIFCSYFNVDKNKKFLNHINYCFNEQKWSILLKLMKRSCEAALARLLLNDDKPVETGKKQKGTANTKKETELLKKWTDISNKLEKLETQLKNKNALAFAFIEGSLVKAVKNGHWVLLDEINLANAETLECLSGLLESREGSLNLFERGDKELIKRHPNFSLFACMNPSTDIGKKDLPIGLRNRFTEFFVEELTEKSDLLLLTNSYLNAMALPIEKLEKIVKLYLSIRKEAYMSLSDGLGHKPHFSLRSLCRALVIASKNPCGVFLRSLFESFLLSFLTQLDSKSYNIVEELITKYILGKAKDAKGILQQHIPIPAYSNPANFVNFEGYWIAKGYLEPSLMENYILTQTVKRNLKDLARVISLGHLPVLLQGETSVGKTSLITYIAKASGNKCMRINNHEHTDLQEYIGSYIADESGKLVFREGVLVEAMRKGHWIILDELNLAPTDVLEALNRVLDDNRELFITETQQTVKAHPNFMLFATQNPPGLYGGRKMLSRAFRNRFVELHFNEIPSSELEFILHRRCEMPLSYSKKMVAVMIDLQMRRRKSAAFAGKQGFITLRDLFRWGERYRLAKNIEGLYDWDQHLADEGYLLLAGRVRRAEERDEIASVIECHMKRKIIPDHLFTLSNKTSSVTKPILQNLEENKYRHRNIVWTFNMRQIAVLVCKALDFQEPVLMVGETGGGKTTICQLIAENCGQDLITINCHMHTESSDFLGGLRPARDHKDEEELKLFEWVDGPLIKAVTEGSIFLADEISLADDSVLERLNSLLESERTLLLAEKGTDINCLDSYQSIVAHENFRFIGTMNPGGDYGKKELSPALRNRFTEIWCESCKDRNDLIEIIECNLKNTISMCNSEGNITGIGKLILEFVDFLTKTELGMRLTITIRDILTWVNFINMCSEKIKAADAYIHGACLTFLDGIGSGVTSTESPNILLEFNKKCLSFLKMQLQTLNITPELSYFFNYTEESLQIEYKNGMFGINPFYIMTGPHDKNAPEFCFDSPTTKSNALRLLRGMQLNKAILLEGSPGVGKTSLVIALAKCTGNRITRINLSDQTDISDLFGADLPVEGGSGGQFAWRDGPFLQALKHGDWVLLDELNLASQSVLEGLNACLDHRGEIFIPELAKTFYVKAGTRLFACQNPVRQGGSRRGLPQSFLNRFTQVYVHPYNDQDLQCVLLKMFPNLPTDTLNRMVEFNSKVVNELKAHSFGHKGSPWEFNLRDLTRWCEATVFHNEQNDKTYSPESLVEIVYSDRMRTLNDKKKVKQLFEDIFCCKVSGSAPLAYITKDKVFIGDVYVKRNTDDVNVNVLKQDKTNLVLRHQLPVLRSLCYCVNLNWMAILVGKAGSGKSSVVHTLAKLIGKDLCTIPVTPAMDTADLLGGFEQNGGPTTDYRMITEWCKRYAFRFPDFCPALLWRVDFFI